MQRSVARHGGFLVNARTHPVPMVPMVPMVSKMSCRGGSGLPVSGCSPRFACYLLLVVGYQRADFGAGAGSGFGR